VAAALDHIHAKGMLHRDMKPGNIFLDGFLKPYLGDFGIAKVVDESGGLAKEETLTATKMAVGTPEYMAPELFKPRSKPDGRADQYALAVTVYEMLAGDKPFKGDRAHIIVEHSGLPVPPLAGKVPGLPQRLYLAVEKSLAKKAEDRFATCSEFAAAVLEEVSVLPPEPDTVRLLCPSCKNILKLPQRAAGRTGRCPRCQAAMDVAADLGSLWLEAEERGGEAMVPAPSQAPPAVREQTQPEKRSASPAWNGRRRAAAAVAVAVATVVGVILLQRFLSQQRSVAIPRAAPATTSATRNEQAREAAQHAAELRRLQTALEEARAVAQSTSNANQRLQRAIDEARTSQAALASKADELQMALDEAQKSLVAATGRADGLAMKQDGLTTDVRRLSEALSTPDALTNSIGMRFRLCRSGTFPMGDATGNSDEEPLHVVAITKPFYIGMYEVTNSQWMRVMGEVPSTWKDADQPVANVTWDDVNEFCRRLSALSEEQGAGRVYRLPTEAEWEYACRAGTTTRWSFGDDKSRLVEYAWVGRQAERQTHPVGQKKPNGWGLYDMYGNVWEWCSDWYDENYYATSPAVDPQGPASGGSRRVDRGGASGVDAVISRSAFRHSNEPRHRHDILGFRVVLSSSGTAEAAAAR
jgi:formylglycine-generating enzyme required for sulfatase activity